MILTDDTQKVILQLIVQSDTDPKSANLRANPSPDHKPEPYIRSYIDDPPDGEENTAGVYRMPIINPEELVGQTFGITKDNQPTQIRIVEAIKDHQNHVDGSSANIQFQCSMNNDAYEEILTYNQILEYMSNQDDDDGVLWKFKDNVGHQGPLSKTHDDYKGSPYNVTVLWENGETSNEPLSVIAADNPVSCAMYA